MEEPENECRVQADKKRFRIFVLVYLAFVAIAIAAGPAGGNLNGAGMACAILLTLPWFYVIGLLIPPIFDLPLPVILSLCSALNVITAVVVRRIRAKRLSQSLHVTPHQSSIVVDISPPQRIQSDRIRCDN